MSVDLTIEPVGAKIDASRLIGSASLMHLRAVAIVLSLLAAHYLWRSLVVEANAADAGAPFARLVSSW